jgi:hypothetical protein
MKLEFNPFRKFRNTLSVPGEPVGMDIFFHQLQIDIISGIMAAEYCTKGFLPYRNTTIPLIGDLENFALDFGRKPLAQTILRAPQVMGVCFKWSAENQDGGIIRPYRFIAGFDQSQLDIVQLTIEQQPFVSLSHSEYSELGDLWKF